jgi:hypothetical protein
MVDASRPTTGRDLAERIFEPQRTQRIKPHEKPLNQTGKFAYNANRSNGTNLSSVSSASSVVRFFSLLWTKLISNQVIHKESSA